MNDGGAFCVGIIVGAVGIILAFAVMGNIITKIEKHVTEKVIEQIEMQKSATND